MGNEIELKKLALECEADGAAVMDVAGISFYREFRAACEANVCGKSGKCWMCPPDVGDIDDMIKTAKTRQKALIFQTIGELEDSFDIDNMQLTAKRHNSVALKLAELASPMLSGLIKLGAGACHVCDKCTRADDIPCRYPDKAMASLESYGINVTELANACKLKYNNGPNTVTYFGGFLYNE